MVKVLIYSSKEIYDNSSYEGRAEADIIAYRDDEDNYCVMKDRTGRIGLRKIYGGANSMKLYIHQIENAEWREELEKQNCEEYDPHRDPSKWEYYQYNASVAQLNRASGYEPEG